MAFGYSDPHGSHPHGPSRGPLSSGPRPGGCRHVPPPAPRHSVCQPHTTYMAPPPPRPGYMAPPPPRPGYMTPPPPRPRYYSPSYTTGSVIATGVAVAAGQAIGQAVAQSVANSSAQNTTYSSTNSYGTNRSMVPGNYPKYCANCGASTTGARACEYCGGYLY